MFENLLAAYNPETGATARKQTGSFYTPREIVNYMVDEALIACLKTKLETALPSAKDVEIRLRHLFAYNNQPHQFTAPEVDALIAAIDSLKSLDPAVGSGAFPMGILHKLVFILGKLDPRNEKWKERQIARVRDTMATAEKIEDATARERALSELEQQITGISEAFEHNELDYGRKLYLIENCIYGVDIQPIAVQIAKMRFFISLIVDQKINDAQPNRGVRPLPNLETKFVAANTLIAVERKEHQADFLTEDTAAHQKLKDLRQQLTTVRQRHFLARTPASKTKCRQQDQALREKMSGLLQSAGLSAAQSRQLATWNPYDQNASANFFDAGWMFGITEGFDISIGNPPYVRIQTLTQTDAEQAGWLKEHYASARKGNYDLYVVFVERGLQLLQPHGQLAFILPHKFFNAQYGEPLRKLLADGRHVRHVVHFGDQQVFPGATNYVCLLFLAHAGAAACRWVRADDLPAWLVELQAPEIAILAERVTIAEWNFAVGKNAGLFEKLQKMPVKLGDVANIFVGLQTSADDVYIMNFVSETPKTFTLESKALEQNWTFEKDLLYPVVSGTDVSPFAPLPSRQFILFPYRVQNENAELISLKTLSDSWPRTAEYLLKNKKRLEEREKGSFKGNCWHRFGRSQNLGIQNRGKLCVPRLVEYLHAAPDFEGKHFLDNVDVGGLTFKHSGSKHDLAYLLALLNSRLLRWFFPNVSAPFRGGFRSANKQFLSVVAFRPIDFGLASERAQHDALVKLVNHILAAKQRDAEADTSALEREIDQQVYALYGLTPEEIKIVEDATK